MDNKTTKNSKFQKISYFETSAIFFYALTILLAGVALGGFIYAKKENLILLITTSLAVAFSIYTLFLIFMPSSFRAKFLLPTNLLTGPVGLTILFLSIIYVDNGLVHQNPGLAVARWFSIGFSVLILMSYLLNIKTTKYVK